ncbi:hypothetical protein ACFL35_11290 [Candidatus Riflebacteria bacterium]
MISSLEDPDITREALFSLFQAKCQFALKNQKPEDIPDILEFGRNLGSKLKQDILQTAIETEFLLWGKDLDRLFKASRKIEDLSRRIKSEKAKKALADRLFAHCTKAENWKEGFLGVERFISLNQEMLFPLSHLESYLKSLLKKDDQFLISQPLTLLQDFPYFNKRLDCVYLYFILQISLLKYGHIQLPGIIVELLKRFHRRFREDDFKLGHTYPILLKTLRLEIFQKELFEFFELIKKQWHELDRFHLLFLENFYVATFFTPLEDNFDQFFSSLPLETRQAYLPHLCNCFFYSFPGDDWRKHLIRIKKMGGSEFSLDREEKILEGKYQQLHKLPVSGNFKEWSKEFQSIGDVNFKHEDWSKKVEKCRFNGENSSFALPEILLPKKLLKNPYLKNIEKILPFRPEAIPALLEKLFKENLIKQEDREALLIFLITELSKRKFSIGLFETLGQFGTFLPKNLIPSFVLNQLHLLGNAVGIIGDGEIKRLVHHLVHSLKDSWQKDLAELNKFELIPTTSMPREIKAVLIHPKIRLSLLHIAFRTQISLTRNSRSKKGFQLLFYLLREYPLENRLHPAKIAIQIAAELTGQDQTTSFFNGAVRELKELLGGKKGLLTPFIIRGKLHIAQEKKSQKLLLKLTSNLVKCPLNKDNIQNIILFCKVYNEICLSLNRVFELEDTRKLIERLSPRSLQEHFLCLLFECRSKILVNTRKEKALMLMRKELESFENLFNKIWCLSALGLSLVKLGEIVAGMECVNDSLVLAKSLEDRLQKDQAYSSIIHTLSSIALEKDDLQIIERAVSLFPKITQEKNMVETGEILYNSYLVLASHLKRPDFLKKAPQFLCFPLNPLKKLKYVKKQAAAFLAIGEKSLAFQSLDEFRKTCEGENISSQVKKEIFLILDSYKTELDRQEFYFVGVKTKGKVVTKEKFNCQIEANNLSRRNLNLRAQAEVFKEEGRKIYLRSEAVFPLQKDESSIFNFPLLLESNGDYSIDFTVFDEKRPLAVQKKQLKIQVQDKPPELLLLEQAEVNLNSGEWNSFWIKIGNKSPREAMDIQINISGPLEIKKQFKKINNLTYKKRTTLKFSLKPREAGEIPVDIDLEYSDTENRFYTKTFFLNLISISSTWECSNCEALNSRNSKTCAECGEGPGDINGP